VLVKYILPCNVRTDNEHHSNKMTKVLLPAGFYKFVLWCNRILFGDEMLSSDKLSHLAKNA
jgi:hypothetical protein